MAVQHLRLTPRNHDGQHVVDWRIDVDRDCRLVQSEDAFGNTLHRFSVDGPIESISTVVEGEVTTFDMAGVVSGAVERFPPILYMRETPLTTPSAAICDFARETTSKESGTLAKLHALLGAIYELLHLRRRRHAFGDDGGGMFRASQGRLSGFFASLHRLRARDRRAGALCERLFPKQRWRGSGRRPRMGRGLCRGSRLGGFDPTHGVAPHENHVRVAVALDYLGAAPIRGAHSGGAGETLDVKVRVAQAAAFSQSQSQSQ